MRLAGWCGIALVLAACGAEEPVPPAAEVPGISTTLEAMGSQAQGDSDLPIILFLGDSLSAGLGVAEEEAFPQLVNQRLCAAGERCRIVNAGVSGDTTAGGAERLDWLLQQQPDLVVVELGANDGLRGLPNPETEANLRRILERLQAEAIDALLVGMQIPPNYGPQYTAEFAAIYPRLAEEFEVSWIPFLLDGVAGSASLNQADGIHPTAEGHRILATTVLRYLEPWLADREDRETDPLASSS